MIPSSRMVKLAALGLAAGVHGLVAASLVSRTEVQTAGAPGSAEIRLGSAFADMAAGTMQSRSAQERAAPATPEQPVDAAQAEPAPPPADLHRPAEQGQTTER
ncbi:MAG: hypothetical protein ACLFRU_03410, partial [Paracoccaceae bacterium]